jgi:hypothetical protein
VQFSRPNSDITPGGWTVAPLWSKVNEASANDSPLISSGNNASSDICRLGLTAVSAPQAGTRTIRYRYRKDAAGGHTINVLVRLLSAGTLVQEWTHNDVTETFVTATQTVTGTVSDWSALTVEFERTGSTGGAGGTRRSAQVSWMEFEVPAAGAVAIDGSFTATAVASATFTAEALRFGPWSEPVAGTTSAGAADIRDGSFTATAVASATFTAEALRFGPWSEPVAGTTLAAAPDAPVLVSATAIGPRVDLLWQKSTGATGYRVERRTIIA